MTFRMILLFTAILIPFSNQIETTDMYSLIIPIFNNEGSINELLDQIEMGLASEFRPLEVVFVVDGSTDESQKILEKRLPSWRVHSKLITLSRNFGSFSAIRSGLAEASGKYYAMMAADLQEPVSLIKDFFRALQNDSADVVVGRRDSRHDPWFSKLLSTTYWALYRKFILPEMPSTGIDTFGCNENVRNCLLNLREANTSLVGLLFWLGFRRQEIGYDRKGRHSGKSGWNFSKRIKYFFDSVFGFSDLPVHVLLLTGAVGILVSVVLGGVAITYKLLGITEVSGYTMLLTAIVFFSALNLLGMGVLGSYIWRTFENSKQRPLSLIASRSEFKRTASHRSKVTDSALPCLGSEV